MDKETPKPPINGFELSTDYVTLWSLINVGYRVPAWIIYDKKMDGSFYWDIVEVKKWPNSRYMIGYRGCGYEGFENTLMDFCRVCEKINLNYIAPSTESEVEND
jgi:hypothetical protein